MKNLKLILTSIALMLTVLSVSANDNLTKKLTSTNIKSKLHSKIVSILGKKTSLKLKNNKEINANISFLINKKNEIIVISVDTDNRNVDSYVKNKLNYKKVYVNGIKEGEVYQIPLKVKKA